MTNHAAGIGTCTQSGKTIPSYPSSEMHLGKFPDHTGLQSWNVNFRTEVCSKAKNPTLALQRINETEVAKSREDLITPKSAADKDFTDCQELDLMMAAVFKRCYDISKHTSERNPCRGAESSKRQPVSQSETNCLFDLRKVSSYWLP